MGFLPCSGPFRAVLGLKCFSRFYRKSFFETTSISKNIQTSSIAWAVQCVLVNRCRIIQDIRISFERASSLRFPSCKIPTETPIETKQESIRSDHRRGSYENGTKAVFGPTRQFGELDYSNSANGRVRRLVWSNSPNGQVGRLRSIQLAHLANWTASVGRTRPFGELDGLLDPTCPFGKLD